MKTYLIYATNPADCLALTIAATKLGKAASDRNGIIAVRYDGPVGDVSTTLEREAPNVHYLVVEVSANIAWKSAGELATVGDLILGLR